MKRTIKGEKYNFVINFSKCKSNFYFEIEATNLQNKTRSFINNVNSVLSQFDVDINDNEKMESQWEVKEKEGKIFFKKSTDFISDKVSRKYLEKQLNTDQKIGEWNKSIINKEVIN